MNPSIRPEQSKDFQAIEAVIIAAFLHAPHTSHTEHFIVQCLRDAQALTLSLVAESEGGVMGHVAVSPVSVSDGATSWYGLGPLSVLPECQGRGIGGQLLQSAVAELKRLGAAGCVLLGDPAYYARFGFRPVPGLVLPEVPAEYFQALSFSGCFPQGTVSYHPAFGASA